MAKAETKFTPGPWSAEDDRIEAQGTLVATIPDAGDFPCADDGEHDAINAECVANARLIAAAPDLYAAVRSFVNAYQTGMLDSPAEETLANVVARAVSALSRVEQPQ